MIILDTNVVTAIISAGRDHVVDDWLDRMDPTQLWLPTLVVAEMKFGVDILEDSRRRRRIATAFRNLIEVAFAGRIIAFDLEAAIASAAIAADRRKRGRPSGAIDTLIAGVAVSRKAAIATRNVKHFADLPVPVINPWAS
jgi:toxin FitB